MDRRTFITSSMALAATPLVGLAARPASTDAQDTLRLGVNWEISAAQTPQDRKRGTLHRDSYLRPGPIRYLDLDLYHWPMNQTKVLEYCPISYNSEGFRKSVSHLMLDGLLSHRPIQKARQRMGAAVRNDLWWEMEVERKKYPNFQLGTVNISLVQEGLSENTQLRSIRLHTGHDTPDWYYLPVLCLAYAPDPRGDGLVHVLKNHQLFTLAGGRRYS